ncbi:hypothetical protein BGP75_14860 [Motiliproteus sp. MSK22-1]|nr:hypothetical protein BGP75_14860 [Motiliproteus sp. MSK22-1]
MLLVICLSLLIGVGVQRFLKHAPKYGKPFLIRVGLIALALLLVGLALSGRLHWVIGLLAGLLPFLRRLVPLVLPLLRFLLPNLQRAHQKYRSQRQGTSNKKDSGEGSVITTVWLKMSLDHDSGEIQGEIIGGDFKGRNLDQLNIEELSQFYQQCQQQDKEAIRLLDTYIQRSRLTEWEQHSQSKRAAANHSEMTPEEAWEILGLQPGSAREDILIAHKRMMMKVHPDKGGSNYLASKINQAKELLLKEN